MPGDDGSHIDPRYVRREDCVHDMDRATDDCTRVVEGLHTRINEVWDKLDDVPKEMEKRLKEYATKEYVRPAKAIAYGLVMALGSVTVGFVGYLIKSVFMK